MRDRLSYPLTALSLLFLVQATNALFGVLFAVVYQGLFPELTLSWLALALVPVGALLAPALPFSLWVERSPLLVWAAASAAAARVLLCLPAFPIRFAASALGVAAGVIFLGKAVGHLDRRSVAAGAATALVLDQLLRLAGWSYDVSQRPAWLPVQIALSLVTIGLAFAWRRRAPELSPPGSPLERRAGGVRLRGAVALGVILFLELSVLGRAEVAQRWLGVPYEVAALTLIGVGSLVTLALLASSRSLVERRSVAVPLALVAASAAVAGQLGGVPPALSLAWWAAGHAGALLLLERALVTAGGRRRGWRLAAGLGVFFTLNLSWALTFFYAFAAPAFQDRATAILIMAGALLASSLGLMPRPAAAEPSPHRPRVAAVALVASLGVAGALALRPATVPRAQASDTLRVATFNIHYGFDEDWRYDPERIARTIEESGARVVALQEVAAGLATAYGTDLAFWLGRRLGMRAFFAPSINGLMGDAVLTALPVAAFSFRLLPPADGDRKQVARVAVLAGPDTVPVYATHFSIHPDEQTVQAAEVVRFAREPRALLLGDLNAQPGGEVLRILHAAGFRDAFEGAPAPPTSPASRPAARIDWVLGRGYGFADATVSAGGGSDHRLVAATIRMR